MTALHAIPLFDGSHARRSRVALVFRPAAFLGRAVIARSEFILWLAVRSLLVVPAAFFAGLLRSRLALENEGRVRELQDSRERIVAAGDDERRRLERNLHDGAQQRLVGIALQLRLLRKRVAGDPCAVALVTAVSEELAHSLAELRELARGIHPSVLDHGLDGALESLITRCPVPARLEFESGPSVSAPVELAAYFVVSEALTNVAKYADATSVSVTVTCPQGGLVLRIADDGVGGADADSGSGLRGLSDRVGALGGHLRVLSPPGRGTVVIAELPYGAVVDNVNVSVLA